MVHVHLPNLFTVRLKQTKMSAPIASRPIQSIQCTVKVFDPCAVSEPKALTNTHYLHVGFSLPFWI